VEAKIMNDDDVWAAIDSQRRRTANLLEQLSDEEWGHPSLCEGWTVRDVAAHLTLQQLDLGAAIRWAITHPSSLGGVNRMIRRSAHIKAQQPTERLIAEIRAMVGSRRHNVGLTSFETLTDILVHGQDIAIPLKRELRMPLDASAVVATRVWAQHRKRMARVFRTIPIQGFRFTAIDVAWSVGQGREIQGPISALLLLLTGRVATLPQLSGDGMESLCKQLLPA